MEDLTQLSMGAIVALLIIKEVLSFVKARQANSAVEEENEVSKALVTLATAITNQTEVLTQVHVNTAIILDRTSKK